MARIQYNKLVQPWVAVAQNTIAKSEAFSLVSKRDLLLHVQAALDTTVAHTGTRFIIQTSASGEGDADWQNHVEFVGLIGTATTDLTESDLIEGSTSITLTGHVLTALGEWLFIEDATLENSEIVMESAQTTNSISLLDGVENEHAIGTSIFNIVMEQSVKLPQSANRVRVIVDNSYDSNGSGLDYKMKITAILGV